MKILFSMFVVLAFGGFVVAGTIDHSPIDQPKPVPVPVPVKPVQVVDNCPGGVCPLPSTASPVGLPAGRVFGGNCANGSCSPSAGVMQGGFSAGVVQGNCANGSCSPSAGVMQGGYYGSQGGFRSGNGGWYPGKFMGRILGR